MIAGYVGFWTYEITTSKLESGFPTSVPSNLADVCPDLYTSHQGM